MDPFFMPKMKKRRIEVKIVKNGFDYCDTFTTIVSDYREVMEVDDFVRRFMPDHHMKTNEFIEEDKDETVETEAADGDNEARD